LPSFQAQEPNIRLHKRGIDTHGPMSLTKEQQRSLEVPLGFVVPVACVLQAANRVEQASGCSGISVEGTGFQM
jgi:hypothetical protein